VVQDKLKTIDLEDNQVLQHYQSQNDYDDPLQHFMYALRAPETKKQYLKRLKMFMDFVQIEGDLKQQARKLKEKIKTLNSSKYLLFDFLNIKKKELEKTILLFPLFLIITKQ